MTSSKKVLIVEDERLVARSLKLDLEDLGIVVLEPVSKGEDAVQIALDEQPDLIFMDIRLAGGKDGIETAEEIGKSKKIPILFMTGYATEQVQSRAESLFPVAFLEKPLDMDVVKGIMDNLN